MPDTERIEAPVLQLPRAAVCLHYVERPADGQAREAAYPMCPVFRSMELDLLSYRFQIEGGRPFGTRCVSSRRLPVRIHFPPRLAYHSEGRRITLVCPRPQREVEATLCCTAFLQSGVRLWHVTLTPAQGEAFSEFDIIKLIHLYDGRTEDTRLHDQVKFEVDGGEPLTAAGLLTQLGGPAAAATALKAGTVQILDNPSTSACPDDRNLLDIVRQVREKEQAQDRALLEQWVAGRTPEGRILEAYCGIVTGIFDFDEIDDEEMLDTLEPSFPESSALLRIHRCTLTSISADDRIMEECWPRVGSSPYLIIPHAVLLHNDEVVDIADEITDAALSGPAANLQALEKRQQQAEVHLNRLYLPNVFHYVTERALFSEGSQLRGSVEKRSAVQVKLKELEKRIELGWQLRRERGQMAIAALLAVLSLLYAKDELFELMPGAVPAGWRWLLLAALAGLLAYIIVRFWRAGLRGSETETAKG